MRWFMSWGEPDQKLEEDGPPPDPNVRYISTRKTNYAVKDSRKLVWSNGLFVPEVVAVATPGAAFNARYAGPKTHEESESAVLAAVDRFAATERHARAAKQSPDYLPKRMEEAGLADGFKRKDLARALERLLLSGKVKEVALGKNASRSHERMGLILMGPTS
jgi:hypothetical protein